MKAQTRSLMSLCLAVVLVLSAVLGTIAYMTAQDSVTNTFTVGSFSKPTTDPNNPDTTLPDFDGYIYEPNWVNNSKLVPGDSIAKDPRVGIGKGSEDAWVYVYIKNNLITNDTDAVTFTLNEGWEVVEATEVTTGSGTYTGGLFKYNTKLSTASGNDAWTATIFDKVDVSADATVDGFDSGNLTMVVNAYIHQAKDDSGDIDTTTIDNNAKTWAAGL